MAYVLHYVRGLKVIRNKNTGKVKPVWNMIPMVRLDELDGDDAVSAADERLGTVKEHTAEKNEAFNAKYNTRRGTRQLYEFVLDRLANIGMSSQTLFVTKHVARVTALDRRLEIKLKHTIKGKSDEKIIISLNKKGTEALQDFLKDSAAEFRVVGAME